jgi:hypothetical protein
MFLFANHSKIVYQYCIAIAICVLVSASISVAQNISGQINNYAAVTSFGPCSNKLNVSSTAGFNPNSKVLLIQMQGAKIDISDTPNFGDIDFYNSAGSFEKATITAIEGNEITLQNDLLNIYDVNGKVQLVTIPQFTDVTVSGTLIPAPWNGSTGGVLAFEATGTVTLNANISADGLGFRGGAITNDPQNRNNCNTLSSNNDYFYDKNSLLSAFKGEGIAQFDPGKELGRGAQANGGGGGNDHNSGGGGGGSEGAGGGGGRNNEPGILRCKGNFPGVGGRPLEFDERVFLGGGGGGGHSNNTSGSAGGNGGGIIYISANLMDGNSRTISANGITASNSNGDGAGGGGAGGAILLNINSFTPDALSVQANGGDGGSANNNSENRCFGPGGGGGGGVVAISNEKFPEDVVKSTNGGNAGLTLNSRNNCNNGANGASAGADGLLLSAVKIPQSPFTPDNSCSALPVDFISFKAVMQSGKVNLEWITGSELNNEYFVVERSEDGEQFTEVARVNGKGNTNGISTYQTIDPNPFVGISYYRIRQVDTDGTYSFSKTVSVENNSDELAIQIFPNPVQERRILFHSCNKC